MRQLLEISLYDVIKVELKEPRRIRNGLYQDLIIATKNGEFVIAMFPKDGKIKLLAPEDEKNN